MNTLPRDLLEHILKLRETHRGVLKKILDGIWEIIEGQPSAAAEMCAEHRAFQFRGFTITCMWMIIGGDVFSVQLDIFDANRERVPGGSSILFGGKMAPNSVATGYQAVLNCFGNLLTDLDDFTQL